MSRRRAVLALAGLGLGALALRLAVLALGAHAAASADPALGWRDLALLFDGRLYLLVARTFPTPYQGSPLDPTPIDAVRLTIYLPLLPAGIWLAHAVLGDWRAAALALPLAAGAAAVLLFERLARGSVRRPRLAAALLAAAPPVWVVASSLPFAESLALPLAIGAFLALRNERHVVAAILVGFAMLAQKNGFLLLPALALALGWRHGAGALRLAPRYALALLPPLALQLHLAALFGDPFANLHATREIFGGGFFAIPGAALVDGLFNLNPLPGESAWLGRTLRLGALAFYGGALALGDRRDPRQAPLVAWLAVSLAFALSLGGVWAWYDFPRYALLGAPPAILLWLARFEGRLGGRGGAALVALAAALSLAVGRHAVGVALAVLQTTGDLSKLPAFRDDFFR
jgi:hypothetical protein